MADVAAAPVVDAPVQVPVQAPAQEAPGVVETPSAPQAPEAPKDGWDALPEEVRRTADPYVKPLKEKLSEYEKKIESAKGSEDKAMALDRLVQDKDFQSYWAKRMQTPQEAQLERQAPYTPEEYQAAYDRALQGDLSAMNGLQEKLVESVLAKRVSPAIGQLQNKAREIELSFELNELLSRHPDARELDSFGFLEPALHYFTDKQGKPMEFAYVKAKEAYDKAIGHYKAKEAKEIQDKRNGVTERPGIVTGDQGIQYLDSPEAVLKAQIIGNMKGEKVQYRLRPRK